MQEVLPEDAGVRDERVEWELGGWLQLRRSWLLIQTPPPDFRGRCIGKLEKLGDIARDSEKHDEAIGYYSDALSLDPTKYDILLRRSEEVWSVRHMTLNNLADWYCPGRQDRPVIP